MRLDTSVKFSFFNTKLFNRILRLMGICASSNTTMGSTFTSMEDKNEAKKKQGQQSNSRSGKYSNNNSTTSDHNSITNNTTKSHHTEPINDIIVGRSGEFYTCSDDKTICHLNSNQQSTSSQIIQRWSEHKRSVTRMTYGTATDTLWTCSRDLTMKLWKRGEENSICTIKDGHDLNITALSLSPNESLLCSGSRDTTVCLWDIDTGARIFRKKTSRNLVTCMQWMNADTVVQGSEDLKLRLWDCRDHTLEATSTMTGYIYFPLCIDVIDDYYVCTGSKGFDGTGCEVRVWDMRTTKQCVSELNGHRQSVVGCRFLDNKNRIVTVSKDQTLKIWNSNVTENSENSENNSVIVDILGHTGSQFTCIDYDNAAQHIYGGAANGYSKYKYNYDDTTSEKKDSIEHMRTYSNNEEQ